MPEVIFQTFPPSIYGCFPKLGVPFLEGPIIGTLVFWGLYLGPFILGNYLTPFAYISAYLYIYIFLCVQCKEHETHFL